MLQDMSKFQAETEIDGNKFVIHKLGAMEAFVMGKDLMKVVAPLFGGTLDGMRETYDLEAPRTFTELAVVLSDRIDTIGIEQMAVKLLRGVTKNGVEIKDLNDPNQIETHEFFELFGFALQENFKKLFMGKGMIAQLRTTLTGMMDDSSEQSKEQ